MKNEDAGDDAFDALSDATRRQVLMVLLNRDTALDLNDSDPVIYGLFDVALYNIHLPKLDETGYIRWDRERSMIEKGPRFDEIRPLLTVLADYEECPDPRGP